MKNESIVLTRVSNNQLGYNRRVLYRGMTNVFPDSCHHTTLYMKVRHLRVSCNKIKLYSMYI